MLVLGSAPGCTTAILNITGAVYRAPAPDACKGISSGDAVNQGSPALQYSGCAGSTTLTWFTSFVVLPALVQCQRAEGNKRRPMWSDQYRIITV